MTSVERALTVDAPAHEVWEVLADFGALSSWVPMIDHSCLLSEQREGTGAFRRVQVDRQTLVERVTRWDPPRELAYAIEGLPPIVGSVHNTWRLTAAGAGTDVALTTGIDTGWNPVKRLIARQALRRMAAGSGRMLAGLAAAVTESTETADEEVAR